MWITLTPADLRTRFSEREMDTLRRANAAFDDAAAQAVLDQTAATARGYIAGWSSNRLAAIATAIPPALKATCLDIAVVDFSQSLAGQLLDPKSLRQKAYDRAIKRLESVSEGKFAIEQPDASEAQTAASASGSPTPPTSYSKTSTLSRADQAGSY